MEISFWLALMVDPSAQGKLVCDKPASCDATTPSCWLYSCVNIQWHWSACVLIHFPVLQESSSLCSKSSPMLQHDLIFGNTVASLERYADKNLVLAAPTSGKQ